MNHRSQRRKRRRLAKGFLKQGDGALDVVELGKKEESLRPRWAGSCPGEEVDCSLPGARFFACLHVSAYHRDRSAMMLVACIRRRQP